MGQVVPFAPAVQADEAWKDYIEYAARAVNNPALLLERPFFNEMTRREDRYKRAFLASERAN